MEPLSPTEKRVLVALGAIGEKATPDEILARGAFREIVEVMNGSSWLQAKGLVRHEETMRNFIALGREGADALERGLPERRALVALAARGGRATVADVSADPNVGADEANIATGWLKRKGLVDIRKEAGGSVLEITDQGRKLLDASGLMPDEIVLAMLRDGEVPEQDLDPDGLKLLLGRQNLVRRREEITRVVHLTEKGRRALVAGITIEDEGVSQITPDFITSGAWRREKIRPYDVSAFAPTATGGKKHPLRQVIDEVRHIFLSMGFTEIEGPYVTSAFWDLDALFVPQDHPARAMQDTFYLERPATADLSNEPYVKKIKAVHENGGGTGSTGWRHAWDPRVAEQNLLRTHTTPDTLQYLKAHPEAPIKIFSVDRVFRNEAIDATHLPEFHQVEGVVHEEGGNLRTLIALLREFTTQLGAKGVRVRPAYFPYTEPSLEFEVHYNNRWMELGGAGIFRPEVTEPMGIRRPVLAWGLGLERLAMMKLGLKDVRELYLPDIDWLRSAPLVD
ncbi:MAG TPA: phenylalanine--tRNA ligase subunit alpha [Candidatus Thermoplasmatota archaeon]|nr:phenylalanine--tRNA ligase subunit alpha [Candidatus Thermoplasmatota archaeon]